MGHRISAVILRDCFDSEIAKSYDLQGVELGFGLTMFPINHYYTACWGSMIGILGQLPGRKPANLIFPGDRVIAHLMIEIANSATPLYTIITTDYFGGNGAQWALVYRGTELADDSITQINPALKSLGVQPKAGIDEFDTVGLGKYRSMPDFLDKYIDMVERLEV